MKQQVFNLNSILLIKDFIKQLKSQRPTNFITISTNTQLIQVALWY